MMSPSSRPAPSLDETFQSLAELYAREYPDGAPELYERLLQYRIQQSESFSITLANLRRKLNLLVRSATSDKEKTIDDLKKEERMAVSMFLNPQVLKAHREIACDQVLSCPTNSIAHYGSESVVVADDFITAVEQKKPDILLRRGAIFFDVDGTKTIVDCTSHAHAGKYLIALAEFFCKLTPELHAWLDKKGLRAEAYSYAGDEFVMMLRSDETVVTKELLDSFAILVQEAMKNDMTLTSFLSFDDPEFVMEYGEWTEEERDAYKADPSSMHDRYTSSREALPDSFIPSVSFGSATLMQGLEGALSLDQKATTLEELGINAFHRMVEHADARMKEDKRLFREMMKDQTWKNFLLRNGENRRLQQEIDRLREELREAHAKLALLAGSQDAA